MDGSLPRLPATEGHNVPRTHYQSLNRSPIRTHAFLAASLLAGAVTVPAASSFGAAQQAFPRADALPTGVNVGDTTGSWGVTYDGFAHGLLVLKMRAHLILTPGGYDGELSFRTAGMVGWMIHDVDDSHVVGRFAASEPGAVPDLAQPSRFDDVGNLRGADRTTRMSYRGGVPAVETLTPPVEVERKPVPPEVTPNTIDNLSALAMLVRHVGATGRCDGRATLFDGRRLTTLAVRTAGTEALPKTGRSIFAGQALRCDVDGNQLYGFKKNESEAEQRRTKHGNAWLATLLPHAPPVPVRVVFTNKDLGEVTLYLTGITAPPAAIAQARPVGNTP
jgi:hypothetical protein